VSDGGGGTAGAPALERRLERIARVPVLLVASDYDGTLAPIVDDPDRARPQPGALAALGDLARLPRTHVAVISGRALRALRDVATFPPAVQLVGSHGSEFAPDVLPPLPPARIVLRDRVGTTLRDAAAADPGFRIEEKPGGFAFHYRRVDPAAAARALAEIRGRLAAEDGLHWRGGKMVLEVSVVENGKGRALETIRARVGADATIFLGDDVTDEEAFAGLGDPDVGVKIGDGDTRARYRLADPAEAARALGRLGALRAAWLEGPAE